MSEEELKLPGESSDMPNLAEEPKNQTGFERSPLMEALIEELRVGLESGDLKMKERDTSGQEILVPDWDKIYELYKKHGFIKNVNKRGRPLSGYSAGDGTVLDEELVKFWANLNQQNNAVLEKADQYRNTVESVKQLLAIEDIYGDARQILDEIFKRIGASKRVEEGYKIIYIFSDGEMSLYDMTEFLRMRAQSEGIRRRNASSTAERLEGDELKRSADNWWKKYD